MSNLYCSFASNSYAWALQASGGGFIQAVRPFAASLQPGDKVSFVFENGNIDSPGSVGVAFHNRFDQRLAETYFPGGDTNYVVNDATYRNTGIPWGSSAKTCTFELLTTLTYRLTLNGQSFDGTFSDASEYAVAYLRFWNYNAGSGDASKAFFGTLSVTGAPLPVVTYSAETAVTRASSGQLQIQSVASSGSNLVATLNSASGIDGNIWFATDVENNGWNWTHLPSTDYSISNTTVTIFPSASNALQVISVGRPGGP